MNSMDDPKLVEVLTRIETKIDQFSLNIGDHESRIRTLEQHVSPTLDHDSRLTALEKKVWAIPSATLIVSVVTAIIMVMSIPHPATQTNNNIPQSTQTQNSQSR